MPQLYGKSIYICRCAINAYEIMGFPEFISRVEKAQSGRQTITSDFFLEMGISKSVFGHLQGWKK